MERPSRIVVRHFQPPGGNHWLRFVRVLAYTARRHCPSWTVDVRELSIDPLLSSPLGVQGTVWNTHKLDSWAQAVERAKDGEQLLLLDADTFFVRGIDDIDDLAFDLAYTVKPAGSRFPLNGGVVFLRVSDGTRAFIRDWQVQNRLFLDQPLEYQVWSPSYGGVNQTALGVLLRKGTHGLKVKRLACAEWNVEDDHWATVDPTLARIIHCKADLQRSILERMTAPRELRGLVTLWRSLEAEAMHDEAMRPVRIVDPAILRTPEDDLQRDLVTPEPMTPPPVTRRRGKVRPATEADVPTHGRP